MSHPQPTLVDPRAVEILGGVRQAFAEKGFDGASMQDLARACGMSVGNFYRYFPSKAAIVAALITRDLAEMEAQFREILRSPDPMAALRDALTQRITTQTCEGDGQLWAEITAAALRKAEISAITRQMEAEITTYLTTVFARVKALDPDEARRRYHAHAMLLVMLVKASAMHPADTQTTQTNLTALVLRTINRTLDDIVSDDLKG